VHRGNQLAAVVMRQRSTLIGPVDWLNECSAELCACLSSNSTTLQLAIQYTAVHCGTLVTVTSKSLTLQNTVEGTSPQRQTCGRCRWMLEWTWGALAQR